MTSRRGELEEMNRECESICLDQGNWTAKWKGAGPRGAANFRLLYSSPETFDQTDGVMFLGTNPGGDERNADIHDPWVPFIAPRYSAYLDDFWGGFPQGQHPIQRAARSVAAAVAGTHPAGDALLRSSPTGNLIPFRSVNLNSLPVALRQRGLPYGLSLIRFAQPRLLCLLSSNQLLWNALMAHIGHGQTPDWEKDLGAHFTVREAVWASEDGISRYVFALPGLNTSTQARTPEVLALFRQRVTQHGLVGIGT